METNALDRGPGPGEAEEVARDHFGLASPRALPLPGGRVNVTFRVDSGGESFILQRLSPFFQDNEALGINWQRIAQVLNEERPESSRPFNSTGPPASAAEPGAGTSSAGPSPGLSPGVPPIFPDLEGRWLAVRPGRGGAWRLTGFCSGRPVPKNPEGARAAARALGGLHQKLNRPVPLQLLPLPDGEFTNRRLAPLEELDLWPDHYRGHPHWPAIHPLWEKMAASARDLPFHPEFLDVFRLREVVIHGDPKADNFLLGETGEIQAVLDWDTAGLGHVLAEVGEMLRSFGAAAETGEEVSAAAAVVEGYAETGLDLTEADVELLPAVWRALALNLSRRYLADALAEVYFLWDRLSYPSLYEQNRLRGAALLDLAGRLLEREMELIELFQAAARRGGRRPV